MKLRLLHIGPPRLDAPLPEWGAQAELRRTELLECFERWIEMAVAEQADLLLVSGALFATPAPRDATLVRLRVALQRLVATGCSLLVRDEERWRFLSAAGERLAELLPEAVVIAAEAPPWPLAVRERTLAAASLDHPDAPSAALPQLLDAAGAAEGFWLQLDGAALPSETAASGTVAVDWHFLAASPDGSGLIETLPQLLATRPGPPADAAPDKPGGSWGVLVDWRDGTAQARPVTLDDRPQLTRELDVTALESDEDLLAAIQALAEPRAMLQLRLTGRCEQPIDIAVLHQRLAGQFFQLTIEDRTEPAEPVPLPGAGDETLRGVLQRVYAARVEVADAPARRQLADAWHEVLRRLAVQEDGS